MAIEFGKTLKSPFSEKSPQDDSTMGKSILSTNDCLDIFQDVVVNYVERSRVMGEHKEISRYQEIITFLVEIASAIDRQTLGTEISVTNIWAENFETGSNPANAFRRAFIFDITSEFRLRLGKEQFERFVEEFCYAYSMVDADRFYKDNSLSVIKGLNASSMFFSIEGMRDNAWFILFILLSTVRFNIAGSVKKEKTE